MRGYYFVFYWNEILFFIEMNFGVFICCNFELIESVTKKNFKILYL